MFLFRTERKLSKSTANGLFRVDGLSLEIRDVLQKIKGINNPSEKSESS